MYEQGSAIPTPAELSQVRCPFDIMPEVMHEIPEEFTRGIQHFTVMNSPDSVPWIGYYAEYRGA